ncbi:hypothetical protein ACYA01_26850, partial [Klebsiella pneumoniae]
LLCHGTVCVVGKMRDLILQLSKSSIYSTKPMSHYTLWNRALTTEEMQITREIFNSRGDIQDF